MRRVLKHLGIGALAALLITLVAPADSVLGQIGYQIRASTITATTAFRAPDGDATTPSYSFSSDTNSGFYSSNADDIGVTLAGALRYIFDQNSFRVPDASLGSPSITFVSDTDTGLYSTSDDCLGFAQGGNDLGQWCVATGTLTATQVRKLNATPVELIASPGTGKAIVLESVQLMLDYGGTAYDSVGNGEDLVFRYTDGSGTLWAECDETTCLQGDATADNFGIAAIDNGGLFGMDLVADTNIVAAIIAGEWAAADLDANGNSPIHYLIRYRIVSTDLS